LHFVTESSLVDAHFRPDRPHLSPVAPAVCRVHAHVTDEARDGIALWSQWPSCANCLSWLPLLGIPHELWDLVA
jgi:hypothetical protein